MVCQSQILYSDPPDVPTRKVMEFRLIYDGDLLKASSGKKRRPWEKHSIRRHLHPQLQKLWEVHPALKYYAAHTVEEEGKPPQKFLDALAHAHKKADTGFIPIITEPNGLMCELDVLLLRPERPGHLIEESGDIDNRMKTLLDALKVPQDGNEIARRTSDDPDPNPMYCLLANDNLITGFKVTTDFLLLPIPVEQGQNYAVAIITVRTSNIDPFGSPWELHL
jgi:hypothetical protein